MNALLRIALSSLPYAVAIVLSWQYVTDGIAQGATYLVAGWWASFIGLFVVTMALLGPLLGALVSMFLAEGLQLRPPAAVSVSADRWLTFAGPAVYFGVSWLTWQVMWWRHTPVRTEHALYGPSYFWVLGALGLSVAVFVGGYAAHLVVRRALATSSP